MPDQPPVPTGPSLEAGLASLFRCVLEQAGASRGMLRIEAAGAAPRTIRIDDRPVIDATDGSDAFVQAACIPLDDDRSTRAVIAVERRSDGGAASISAASIALLQHHIPLLFAAESTAAELELLRETTGAIVDDALEPFVSMDASGRIIAWNRAAAATFGWSRDEALGKPAADLIVPPELRARHRSGFANYRDSGQSSVVGHRITLPALRRDGSRLLVEMRVSVSYEAAGHANFHAFLHDVTELEQTRERLTRSENQLREAQQIVALGSYEHDLQTGTVFCSDELFRLLGIDPAGFDGSALTLYELVKSPDSADTRTEYFRAIKEHRPHQSELRLIRPDGETIVVCFRGYARYDDDGRPLRVYGTIQDITQTRRHEAERRELELRSTEAFDRAPFGMSMIGARPENHGTYTRVNDAFCALTGYSHADVIGRPFISLMLPEDIPIGLETIAELGAGRVKVTRREVRMIRRDGTCIWVRQTRSLMRGAHDEPLYFFTHLEDVTQQRHDEAAMAEAHARLKRSIDSAPIGMALTSTDSASAGRFLEVNPALCRLTGYSRDVLLATTLSNFLHPDGRLRAAEAMHALMSGQEAFCTFEERYIRADGSFGWISVHASNAYDSGGKALYCIQQMMDTTERKAAESKLEHLAYHDALTGTLNRRGLTLEVKRRFATRTTAEQSCALLLLDLDHFKYVNDTMGHAAGDRTLRKVANILRRTCRSEDIIARLGGDEFVVILNDTSEAAAIERADDIRRAIQSNLYLSNDLGLRATASIGIAITDGLGRISTDEVIAAADDALSSAKSQGRDRCSVARSPATGHNAMKDQLTWSQRIRSALERDGFELYAQPILDLRTGRIERYELLLRMIGLDGTVIPPSDFLPTAERVGLMPEIDRWVVTRAIAHAASVERSGRRVVFEVNLSGSSLTNESVTACIERELASTELDPRSLVFEITETAAIGKMDQACTFAEKITALGSAFALDDFGAGFSSFYYLKYLPFDYLKIDGEFIRNLTTNFADQQIVKAIVELARGLGKQTIAEFVGDSDTALLLQQYGVDFAQGYFIGKPAPWDADPETPDATQLVAS